MNLDEIRRQMVESGQPGRDLLSCRYCGLELYESEGVLCAREPDPGAASAICKSAPAGPDPEHPLYPSHAIRQVWSTAEMQAEFTVIGFAAPFVVVQRKSDDVTGSLEFTHSPRIYFGWKEA